MNDAILQKKKSQIQELLAVAKGRVSNLESQYSLLLELESGDSNERFTLSGEAPKGMEALGEFSKKQLDKWVRETAPSLKFSIKSLDRLISEKISEGKVRLLKEHIGNKQPAVYQWTQQSDWKEKIKNLTVRPQKNDNEE